MMIFVLCFRRISVEYTKEQHLYWNSVPSTHILLTFCLRIGAFDCSCVFGLVQVFRVPCIIVIGVNVQRTECGSLQMIAAAVVKF